jgi:signal transduction histidine kinase
MRSEITRLNHSVEEVLKFCRGQQPQIQSRQESVDVIINRVVSLLASRFREKSIDVTLVSESHGYRFMTHEDMMIQVLMNIMLNAVDAVGKNGRITIDFGRHENGCRIRIADNGPGIDKSLAEDVFQSFVTFKKQGTGLGLSISKRIVESLGGTICIKPASMGGAQFVIFLPEKTF